MYTTALDSSLPSSRESVLQGDEARSRLDFLFSLACFSNWIPQIRTEPHTLLKESFQSASCAISSSASSTSLHFIATSKHGQNLKSKSTVHLPELVQLEVA